MSTLRKNRQRKLAEHAARQAADSSQTPKAFATEQEKMLGLLNQHKNKLAQVKSREKTNQLKATIVEDYEPYLDGILAANEGGQNPIITTLMVWYLDIGNIDRALELATYAMEHDLAMPAQYERDLPTVIAGELSDAYLSDASPSSDHLLTVLELTADSDLPDNVNARLHKAYGASIEAETPEQAIIHYDRALALDSKSGVKKVRDTLVKRIKDAEAKAEAERIKEAEAKGKADA
jgi:tetratricopeptide (TPR) repeat protein